MPDKLITKIESILDIDHHDDENILKSIIKKISTEIPVKHLTIGCLIPSENPIITTELVLENGCETDNITYLLKTSPCLNVIVKRKACLYPERVAEFFPDFLKGRQIESYVGAPIFIRNNELTGIISLMDVKPLTEGLLMSYLCELLAIRIGAALDLSGAARKFRAAFSMKSDSSRPAEADICQSPSPAPERGNPPGKGKVPDKSVYKVLREARKALKAKRRQENIFPEESGRGLESMVQGLRAIMEQNKVIERDLSGTIKFNLEKIILPDLEKLKGKLVKQEDRDLCRIIANNLIEITTPLLPSARMDILNKLSPSELRVANLIKQGHNTKEIGRILNLSPQTIATHRHNIRKKIGLVNQKENLFTVLNHS